MVSVRLRPSWTNSEERGLKTSLPTDRANTDRVSNNKHRAKAHPVTDLGDSIFGLHTLVLMCVIDVIVVPGLISVSYRTAKHSHHSTKPGESSSCDPGDTGDELKSETRSVTLLATLRWPSRSWACKNLTKSCHSQRSNLGYIFIVSTDSNNKISVVKSKMLKIEWRSQILNFQWQPT